MVSHKLFQSDPNSTPSVQPGDHLAGGDVSGGHGAAETLRRGAEGVLHQWYPKKGMVKNWKIHETPHLKWMV